MHARRASFSLDENRLSYHPKGCRFLSRQVFFPPDISQLEASATIQAGKEVEPFMTISIIHLPTRSRKYEF